MSSEHHHAPALTEAHLPCPDAELIARLLPAEVMWRHQRIDSHAPKPLAQEAVAVARAVPKRQREFAAGRACARAALQTLPGWSDFTGAIPVGADRAPIWPVGVVGTITHNDDICAAAVALQTQITGLGLDIDTIDRFEPMLERVICTPAEVARWLDGTAPAERQRRLAAMFCTKEALYKAQYPITRGWLDFNDVEVTRLDDLDLPLARVELTLLNAPELLSPPGASITPTQTWSRGHVVQGQCVCAHGLCAASVVLRPADTPGV